jgi:hypothetical protein
LEWLGLVIFLFYNGFTIIRNFARLFEKRYRSCHCEHFVPQHKLSEAISGPDLLCVDAAMEKQACRTNTSNSMFKPRRVRAGFW